MNLTVRQALVDPSIYKLAEEFADVVHAHAIVESNETVVSTGDGGQAWGLLQMHPAFVAEYSRWSNIGTHDTWAEAEVKMCAAFYRVHSTVARDLLVQAYNLGLTAVMAQGKRNPEYLQRWTEAYQRVRGRQASNEH